MDVGFASLPATRGDVARMVFATMQLDRLNTKGQTIARSAILADRLFTGVFNYFGTVVHLRALSNWTDPEGHVVNEVAFSLHDPTYLLGGRSYNGLRALPVTAVLDKVYTWPAGEATGGTACVLMAAEATNFVVGTFKELISTDSDELDDAIVLKDGSKVPFTEGEDVQTTINLDPERNQWDLSEGDEVIITLGDDGKAVNIVGTNFDDPDWVMDVAPAKVLPDGTKVDTHLDCYSHPHGFDVPVACGVTINGDAAGRDSLAKYDVIQVAESWVNEDVLIVIRATRRTVEGTVISTSLSYPGEIRRALIEKKGGAGVRESLVINEDGGIGPEYDLPAPGAVVRYGLTAEGDIFVPIGYETRTPHVVCRTYTETGDGKYSATFDVRGQEVTYNLDAPLDIDEGGDCDWVGTYCRLAVIPGTSTVDVSESEGDYSEWDCCLFKILSVDAVNGTLTVAEADDSNPPWEANLDNIIFWDDPDFVVYKFDADYNLVYIGLEGLKAGDWVMGCLCHPTDEPEYWPAATIVTADQWEDLDLGGDK